MPEDYSPARRSMEQPVGPTAGDGVNTMTHADYIVPARLEDLQEQARGEHAILHKLSRRALPSDLMRRRRL